MKSESKEVALKSKVKSAQGQPRCPSCGYRLGTGHTAKHARYAKQHVAAVMRLQKKYADSGKKCWGCGAKLKHYKYHCDRCLLRNRKAKRVKHGWKLWVKGKPGRKPLYMAGE
jgi:hypothetical protein